MNDSREMKFNYLHNKHNMWPVKLFVSRVDFTSPCCKSEVLSFRKVLGSFDFEQSFDEITILTPPWTIYGSSTTRK